MTVGGIKRVLIIVTAWLPQVRKKSGKKDFFSTSGKSQGILILIRENGNFENSQGKVTMVREN